MLPIQREVDRFLTLLRNKIRERGFTQLEVQETLGWGRSYISQLLTRQKNLRVEQVLLILNVIGVEPAEFFRELYGHPPHFFVAPPAPVSRDTIRAGDTLRREIHALAELLIDKGLITSEDLSEAVQAAGRETGAG